jgi:hypothetical protein
METLKLWRRWYQAFEQSVSDGQWDRVLPLLTEDAQYRVVGVPFACVLKGRGAIVNGFRKSLANFDSKFDKRTHIVAGSSVTEPGHVQAHIWGIYEKSGLPKLAFPATGYWHFDGGQIGLMVDIYDTSLIESQEAFAWLAEHAEKLGGLDPSYT